MDCGLLPRCSLETFDGSEVRLVKIIRIIGECRNAIHDISRTELNRYRLPRFNMPLELGIFLGCKSFGDESQGRKNGLVMDRNPFRYQKFISDIAGQDISSHGGSARQAVFRVRDWLTLISRNEVIPSGSLIWGRFSKFQREMNAFCKAMKLDPENLTFIDYQTAFAAWLVNHPWRTRPQHLPTAPWAWGRPWPPFPFRRSRSSSRAWGVSR